MQDMVKSFDLIWLLKGYGGWGLLVGVELMPDKQ